jgi:branched-chain amino acid transport system substrate-binding protein
MNEHSNHARRLLARTLLAAALALSTRGPAGAVASAAVAGDPVVIPVVIPMTGPGAFLGQEQIQALRLIENITNTSGGIRGRPVKFEVADTQSNPQVALQLTQQILAQAKSPLVLGPEFQAECNATAPLFKNGPVGYCIAPTDYPEPGGYRFAGSVSIQDDAFVILRYLRLRGFTRVAVVTATDAAGQVLDKTFESAFAAPENKALHLVAHEHFSYSDISVNAQMARVKAANPEALIAWSTGTPLGTLLHGINDVGVNVPIVSGNGAMTFGQMQQYRGFLPQELLFPGVRAMTREGTAPGPIHDALDVYFKAFGSIGVRPDFAATLIWDGAMLFVDALRHTGPDATPAQVQAYLVSLHGWAGINGLYDFRDRSQRGIGVGVAVMDRWSESRNDFVPVSRPGGVPLAAAGR